jgi:hypothetical protein
VPVTAEPKLANDESPTSGPTMSPFRQAALDWRSAPPPPTADLVASLVALQAAFMS